jgi:hypothetical protein
VETIPRSGGAPWTRGGVTSGCLAQCKSRKWDKAHRRRGIRPPKAGRPWTAEEEALLRQLPPAEVARRTGRTLKAVFAWRRALGLLDGHRRKARP